MAKRIRHNPERIQKFKCPSCGLIVERKVDMRKKPDDPFCWGCGRGMLEVEITKD